MSNKQNDNIVEDIKSGMERIGVEVTAYLDCQELLSPATIESLKKIQSIIKENI